MEENVALDSKKQKKFVKSIRGIKKLIKKNEKIGAKSESKKKDEDAKPAKPFSMRLKDPVIRKKKRKERGLVYLSHIPHGFYEHQMTQYFKQFGVVTNVRVIRSQRTGNSKGFAFVEFREPSVAQIVAETMNNYLMGKRLIKAAYIPPEKQKRRAFRKHWNSVHNPTSVKRLKLKKAFNADKDDTAELKRAKKLLLKLLKTKKKLSGLGINYDFFTPVDVPEALLDKVIKKEKDEDAVEEKVEIKPKKEKVDPKVDKVDKKTNKINKNESKPNKVNKKVKQEDKNVVVSNENKKDNKPTIVSKGNKKDNKPTKVNQKQQKEKEQKLKDAGVKSVEEFISIDPEDSDDESCDFDSDEYEKMIGEDDDFSSSDGSADEGESEDDEEPSGDDDESDDEEAEEEPAPRKGKSKALPKVIQPVQPKKQAQNQQPQKPLVKKQEFKTNKEAKRKAPQKPAVAAKKPKFEKQNQKPMKKQFKKK